MVVSLLGLLLSTDMNGTDRKPIIADLHCDALYMVMRGRKDLVTESKDFEVDIPRLRRGGVTVQVFAVFVDPRTKGYFPYVMRAIETLATICRTDPAGPGSAEIGLALNADEVQRLTGEGKIAAILAIEGGHALEDTLPGSGWSKRLREYYDAGVRIFTVTHNNTNAFGDAALDSTGKPHGGLSEAGTELVREANRLGVIIDVSHAAATTFRDIVRVSAAPVIASHSNARALCDHPRNLTDDQIRSIAKTGGMIGINFHSSFLRPDGQRAVIDDIVRHIEHIVRLVGDDYVGFGSDFDGLIKPPRDLRDVSGMPELVKALEARGYRPATVKKILADNFFRVFRRVCGTPVKED